jgi:hypothetical protein
MITILRRPTPLRIVLVVVVDTHQSAETPRRQLPNLVRVPTQRETRLLARNDYLLALLLPFGRQVVTQLLVIGSQVHYVDLPTMTVIVPERHHGRVVEGTDAVDVVGGLELLDHDFRLLVVGGSLFVIVELGLVQFGPFGQVDAVLIAAVTGTLHSHDLVGVFIHG